MPVAFIGREAGGRWKAPRQLTTEGGQDARWSPDGGKLRTCGTGACWVIAPSGSAPRLLVDSRDPAVRPVPLLAQWSPEGRTVYYKALDGEAARASGRSRPAAASPDFSCGSTPPRGHPRALNSRWMASSSTSRSPSARATSGGWPSTAHPSGRSSATGPRRVDPSERSPNATTPDPSRLERSGRAAFGGSERSPRTRARADAPDRRA